MYDIIIIGSGPAGLSAAIYAQRARLKAVVAEREYMGTGQIAESGRVDNYPALYGIDGFSLGEKFREHAESLGAGFLEAEVTEIVSSGEGYTVKFADGTSCDTRTVIYAAGAAHRRLGVDGEAEFSGVGVSYCAICDGSFYEGKTAAVAGGGDTALEDALLLSKIAAKVLLIHRRSEFRANKTLQAAVAEADNIELVLDAQVKEILGGKNVTGVRISQNGSERIIDTDAVFVAVGTVPNSSLLAGIAELDEAGYVIADETGRTSAPGIFAAGDVRTKALRQVITAASDGANCVRSAEEYITQQLVK